MAILNSQTGSYNYSHDQKGLGNMITIFFFQCTDSLLFHIYYMFFFQFEKIHKGIQLSTIHSIKFRIMIHWSRTNALSSVWNCLWKGKQKQKQTFYTGLILTKSCGNLHSLLACHLIKSRLNFTLAISDMHGTKTFCFLSRYSMRLSQASNVIISVNKNYSLCY